jgi:DNA polymerase-1
MYRAFYGFPSLTHDGAEVGALYGFCMTMLRFVPRFPESMFIAACDSGKHTFRNEMYSGYKANRSKTPDALHVQIPLIKEACRRFGFITVEAPGFEADDIIATYVAKLSGTHSVNIISSDKDLMQLIGDGVAMYDPAKQRYITEEDVIQKFGVTSDKVLDVLALTGDSSDNIPGVAGIGPKTAAAWISEFGSIENLIANIGRLPQNRKRRLLEDGTASAVMSKRLAALRYDLDLPFEYGVSMQCELSAFFSCHGFASLLKMIGE